ncbi:hypothetical protein [Amazonocrinis nigriterrae]|uniref:hypothetical protein n=1 Tax=Amazonocrinis nigriterrae TaxID=2840443 RepID=UPI00298EFFBD|nr:hypothetical protein [Amazonocrinis nigriterrae]
MFRRSELEAMTLQELKALCLRYSIKPTGNAGYKNSLITSLMVFPGLALYQIRQGRGIKSPSFGSIQSIGEALDEMSEPTTEQIALSAIFAGRQKDGVPRQVRARKAIHPIQGQVTPE